jgi:hypothetical protein
VLDLKLSSWVINLLRRLDHSLDSMLDPRFEILQQREGDLDYTQELADALVTLE